MKIAITGGTGFVGLHLANRLAAAGHDVVAVGRRARPPRLDPRVRLMDAEITDQAALQRAFAGCEAVAHCAGINREIGAQTYAAVHMRGTQAVVDAAKAAGVQRIAVVSFLRARPDGPTEYHRSKWAAEEIVRSSGLSWTVLKCGVMYGRGDHMLDHLSHAFFTFPVFGLVGLRDRSVRPLAVDDACRVLEAALVGDARLADRIVAVVGPEEMPLGEAVRRVARVARRRPIFVRLPIAAQLLLGAVAERLMTVPLIAVAQVHILAEGVSLAAPFADPLPADLAPQTPFSDASIRSGLPDPGGFGRADLRWCSSVRQV